MLGDVAAKYVNGKDAHYIRGFLPDALAADDAIKADFSKTLSAEAFSDRVNSFKQAQHIDVESAGITKALGIGSPQQLIDDPNVYMTKYAPAATNGNTVFRNNVAPALRGMLDNYIRQGNTLGFDTKQTAAMFYQDVAQTAKRYGLPELLEYATEKSGINGQREVDTELGQHWVTDIAEATHVKNQLIKGNTEALTKQHKEVTDAIVLSAYMGASKLGDPNVKNASAQAATQRADFMQQAWDNKVPPTEAEPVLKMYDHLISNQGFANVSNDDTLHYLNDLDAAGHLSQDKVDLARPYLTLAHYMHYTQQAAQGEKDKTQNYLQKPINDTYSAIVDSYKAVGKLGILQDTQESNKARMSLSDYYYDIVKNTGKPPTVDALRKYDKENIQGHMGLQKNPSVTEGTKIDEETLQPVKPKVTYTVEKIPQKESNAKSHDTVSW